MVFPSCDIHPPPHTQQPKLGTVYADEELAKNEGPEGDSLTDGADDDISGRLHEHDFKQRQTEAPGIVTGTTEEEPLSAQEAP